MGHFLNWQQEILNGFTRLAQALSVSSFSSIFSSSKSQILLDILLLDIFVSVCQHYCHKASERIYLS